MNTRDRTGIGAKVARPGAAALVAALVAAVALAVATAYAAGPHKAVGKAEGVWISWHGPATSSAVRRTSASTG